MHEIRATLPPEQVAAVTRLARQAGIDRVSVADVYVHGPDQKRQVISVETSTPKARAFVDALLLGRYPRRGLFDNVAGAAGYREWR